MKTQIPDYFWLLVRDYLSGGGIDFIGYRMDKKAMKEFILFCMYWIEPKTARSIVNYTLETILE